MKKRIWAVTATLLALLFALPAHAQTKTALVVTTCGTLPAGITYALKSFQLVTEDVNGNLCTNASGGGGGGTSSSFNAAFPAAGTAIGLSDGTNMKAWFAAIALGDGVNGNDTAATAAWLWNGTTYDRATGTAANGQYVQARDGASVSIGAKADAACGTATGACTLIALMKYNNSTNPVLGAGSAIIGKVGIDQTTPGTTNGVDPTTAASWGIGAPAATAPAKGVFRLGRAASADPTAVTDGQAVAPMQSLSGKTIVLPFTIKELAVRGTADSTDGAAHTIIASAGGSLKNYITDWECSNTSATNITVTFTDSASTKIIVPATGGNNKSLQVPLVTAAATAFQFTASTGVSTVTCNAQGFTGL